MTIAAAGIVNCIIYIYIFIHHQMVATYTYTHNQKKTENNKTKLTHTHRNYIDIHIESYTQHTARCTIFHIVRLMLNFIVLYSIILYSPPKS